MAGGEMNPNLDLTGLEQKYQLPSGLLNAVMQAESSGNPQAVSPKGAQGLFQFMPATAKQYGIDPLDPTQAADGAARYYSDLLKQNNGNLDGAIASYNFGPGNVSSGKPLPPETQNYVAKVKGLMGGAGSDAMGPAVPEGFTQSPSGTEPPAEQALPDGFVLDSSSAEPSSEQAVPEGFVLDSGEKSQEEAAPKEKYWNQNVLEDIAKSAVERGVPEGLAAATPAGLALNGVRGVSDLVRWAAGKAYKALEGEDLPHYTSNPIPTSSDILNTFAKAGTGSDLYEPKTLPGEYANTLAQFASGGAATGVPLRTSIPSAMVSETAGQATQGTDWEIPARTLGALAGAGIGSRYSARQPLKTAEEVRKGASELFKQSEAKSGALGEEIANGFVDDLDAAKPKPIAGKVLTSEDKVLHQALDEYKDLRDTKLTLSDFQRLDSSLGAKAESFIDPKTGKYNAAGREVLKVQQNLRNRIENLPESAVEGGKEGFDLAKRATKEWAKQARMADVERIMQKAEGADNPATVIKNGFRALKDNPNRLRGYTNEEKAAIKYAAKHGVAIGALKFAGGRLISTIAGAVGGAGGGFPGALAGAGAAGVAGAPLRFTAEALQKQRGENVLRTIANRGTPPPPNPLLKLLETRYPSFQSVPVNRIPANAMTP